MSDEMPDTPSRPDCRQIKVFDRGGVHAVFLHQIEDYARIDGRSMALLRVPIMRPSTAVNLIDVRNAAAVPLTAHKLAPLPRCAKTNSPACEVGNRDFAQDATQETRGNGHETRSAQRLASVNRRGRAKCVGQIR